jgi:hypothetical protein
MPGVFAASGWSTMPVPDLGPLPKADRNDALERESFVALQGAVPANRFLLRDERQSDKGVDASLEVLVDGTCTNLRSQLQLKGTDSDKLNADGSFSLSVDSSNLNYLLNGDSPLYILWRALSRELRYVWARDEANRLLDEGTDWQSQGSITLHFRHVLDAAAWGRIHERIMRERRVDRATFEAVNAAAALGSVTVSIDPVSLTTLSSTQVYEILKKTGMALVASGQSQAVLDRSRLLPAVQFDEATIRLIRGYASYRLGLYQDARSDLGRASFAPEHLTQEERLLLRLLTADCEYKLGAITGEEREQRLQALESEVPAGIAPQLRVARLRASYEQEDGPRNSATLTQIIALAAETENAPGAPPLLRRHMRLQRLWAESIQSAASILEALTTAGVEATLRSCLAASETLFDSVRAVINDYGETGPLRDIADASLLVPTTQLPLMIGAQLRLMRTPDDWRLPREAVNAMVEFLAQVRATFAVAGSWEGEIRSVLLAASFLEAGGRWESAAQTATSVEGMARALGLERHVREIIALREGNTPFRRMIRSRSS